MKPLAVFYHCKISGDGIPNEYFALNLVCHQLGALKESGLIDAASEFHIGVNGSDSDALTVISLAPKDTFVHIHGVGSRSEIPTLEVIRAWLPTHPDHFILYHHTKGVTHPGEVSYENWRGRMENACVLNWRQCVKDLELGNDAVGCHWLTPERFPGAVTSPFFGGTFWWSTSKYLAQLPPLPPATYENRYEAESWIGRRRPYPIIRDYFPGWP